MRRLLLMLACLGWATTASAQIAADSTGGVLSSNSGTVTVSYNVHGPNAVLWIGVRMDSLNTTTLTATYNSVSMLNPTGAHFNDGTAPTQLYLFCLAGQTGTHNIVVTPSAGTPFIQTYAMAFSGADQTACTGTNQPDASNNQSVTGSTQISDTLTTTATNVWMVALARDFSAGPPTATGGSVLAIGDGGSTGLYYEGPYATPGSNSLTYTPTGSHVVEQAYASFAPSGGGGTPCKNGLLLLGAGCEPVDASRVAGRR